MTRETLRIPIGRGDLIRALGERPMDAQASQIGAGLGFYTKKAPPEAITLTPPSAPTKNAEWQVGQSSAAEGTPARGIPFWRIDRVEFRDASSIVTKPRIGESGTEFLRPEDMGRDPDASPPPTPLPLVAWSRLRRVMEDIVRRPLPVGEVDLEAVVAQVGRARPLSRIPRRPRRVSGSRVVVVFDRADRLMPFWRDQIELFIHLQRELGQDPDAFAWWRDGPPSWTHDADAVASIDPLLARGDAILVLGDLGLYGTVPLQRRWQALGEALGRRGVLAAALLVCPANRWVSETVRPWRVIDWANPGRASHARTRHGAEARDSLLALLSWTVRLEPAVVRAIRCHLGERQADVGTEADVWNYADVRRHPAGLLLSAGVREPAQRRLLEIMQGDDADERQRLLEVVEIVRRHHAALPREIWTEEALMLELLDPGGPWITDDERRRVGEFIRRVRTQVDPKAEHLASLGSSIDIRGWALRSVETRIPRTGWEHATIGDDLHAIRWAVHPVHEDISIKPGQDATKLHEHDAAPVRRWVIRQRSGQIWVEAGDGDGSLLGTILGRSLLVCGSVGHRLAPDVPCRLPVPVGVTTLEISTSHEQVTLWIDGIPKWAYAAGRDEYGLWAAFRVKGIEQRMRWIPPGRFMMGSPESELGRFDNEVQHEVTLSEGFWLAETPCTQVLWEAVMGTNPSHFKSPRRPVESVSWDDAQTFIGRLNGIIDDLAVELPTEEQWEYACRGGTTTATYAGDLDLRGANNAPVLEAIAWYGGNSGVEFDLDYGVDSSKWPDKQFPEPTRAGSREVAEKQRNPWGLYDMLGNVDEWCADIYRTYGTPATDAPAGERGLKRVFRGGSWSDDARYVRAAFRSARVPGYRFLAQGFRLARGQETAPGEPAKKPAKKPDEARAEDARSGDPTGAARRAREQKG